MIWFTLVNVSIGTFHCWKQLICDIGYKFHWTHHVNWTYIKCSKDVQDVFWTSYRRSIYVMYPRGKKKAKWTIRVLVSKRYQTTLTILCWNLLFRDFQTSKYTFGFWTSIPGMSLMRSAKHTAYCLIISGWPKIRRFVWRDAKA